MRVAVQSFGSSTDYMSRDIHLNSEEYEALQTPRLDDGDSHSQHDDDCLQS